MQPLVGVVGAQSLRIAMADSDVQRLPSSKGVIE